MNKGLWFLLNRQRSAPIRRFRRHFTGWKGALLLAACVVFLLFVVVPQLFAAESLEIKSTFGEYAREFGPHAMLLLTAFVCLSIGGLYFRPEEITYLFPAPIPRHQLLLYNILSRMIVQVLSGFFLALFLVAWCPRWYAALLGAVFFGIFIQLTGQVSGLFFATLTDRFSDFFRRFGSLLLLAMVATSFLLVRGLGSHVDGASWLETLRNWTSLPVIDQLGWVTRPFVETLFATNFAEFSFWGAIVLSILALEVFLILWLDVAFTESAIANSQRLQKKLERMRGGGGALAATGPGKAHFSLPSLPYLGGAGPNAWRQLTEMARHPKPLLASTLMVGAWMIPMFYIPSVKDSSPVSTGMLFGLIFMTTMVTAQLTFDFRRDVDRMAYLRSLPLSGWAIAAGQTLPNWLLVSGLQFLAILAFAFSTMSNPIHIAVIWPSALLANWISVSLDNSVFLLYPYRMAPKDPGQFQFMGRLMLAMFSKMLVFMCIVAACVLPALGVYWLLKSVALAGMMSVVFFGAFAFASTWVCGRLFLRFEAGREIPG